MVTDESIGTGVGSAFADASPLAGMSMLGDFPMTDKLFNRTGVRYEVALDVLGAIIAHHSEVIATERSKEVPDEAVIEQAQQAKKSLRDLRDDLDAKDADAIEHVIAEYGPQSRALYQQ